MAKKIRIGDHVVLTEAGKLFLLDTMIGSCLFEDNTQMTTLPDGGIHICSTALSEGNAYPLNGAFLVLGINEGPEEDACEYLIENIANPNHPILWIGSGGIEKVGK